jgi:hypothetical protein
MQYSSLLGSASQFYCMMPVYKCFVQMIDVNLCSWCEGKLSAAVIRRPLS